ncbi:MFS transporter [Nocardioides daejeonensis]|uniref:MFS transporter n=1 Tax=Nocardioides daejeonensis TaxID=1046556 RepID=UPI000D74F505|nr:MFS transporter [Nocardioides daejeonensis]
MTEELPARVRRGYALGGVATGVYGTVPSLLLMPYLTEELGVGALLAGLIVFAPKAWDFVCNPLAGRVSDRVRRRDRRRPFLLVAGPMMGLGLAFIFTGPSTPFLLALAWVLAANLLAATAYAFFQVPYLAMSAEVTSDYGIRTQMMAWRVGVVTTAIAVSGVLAPWLVASAGGYRAMGAVSGLVIVAGSLAVWACTRGAPVVRSEPAGGGLGDQLRVVLGNVHARPLIAALVLQAAGTSMLLAAVAYAARVLLGDSAAGSYLFAAFVLPGVLSAPLWAWLGRRNGKRSGYAVATVVLGCGLVALVGVWTGSLLWCLVWAAVTGAGYAGIQVFPLAMLPDVAAHDARTSGRNRIGLFAGVWAGFELLGFALGPALLGVVLALGGYEGGQDSYGAAAELAVVAGTSVVPAVLVLVSLLAIRAYRLDDALRTTSREEATTR